MFYRTEKFGAIQLPDIGTNEDQRIGEELCAGAVMMANQLNARAIFVFTRRGFMANILSRLRPDCPIFAFTGTLDKPFTSDGVVNQIAQLRGVE